MNLFCFTEIVSEREPEQGSQSYLQIFIEAGTVKI